ncbi:hypothetical protein B0H16DRAFT_1466233 [Mycena metata]|uniref:Uncharacterized protein n=1 Tax=Mycena metata TaxID=1033252 RepID=A0AAD7I888_9AGAR|nr:hypothetical protein B0H16DRAFT_1466233 [Mycena metata]
MWWSLYNGMVHTRGSVDDHNHFTAVTGDSGWTWDCLLSYFFKNENGLHPWTITKRSANSTQLYCLYTNHVLATAAQLPEDWPFSLNMNSSKPLFWSGIGPEFIDARIFMFCCLSKFQSSSIRPISTGKFILKLLTKKIGGALFTANTTKEIVLSAGTVRAPTILMYSGIGDEAIWANLGIATLLNFPSVG